MTINSKDEWASAIEEAEQVMLRWGHGQVRRVPDEIVEAIVAALRAPVSELTRSEPTLMRLEGGAVIVPAAAWDWLMGQGEDGFEPGPHATKHPGTDKVAAYWWRSEFRRRCTVSNER